MNKPERKPQSRSIGAIPRSITILKFKKINGEFLNDDERKALKNFECYKTKILDSSTNDYELKKNFNHINKLANRHNYQEFLKVKYQI
ncbi:MAG: hypothetical protein MRY83_02450 [Flavobacteriales bacterium]|nr:hypothetical protein [Flavobacteriales bacterium]